MWDLGVLLRYLKSRGPSTRLVPHGAGSSISFGFLFTPECGGVLMKTTLLATLITVLRVSKTLGENCLRAGGRRFDSSSSATAKHPRTSSRLDPVALLPPGLSDHAHVCFLASYADPHSRVPAQITGCSTHEPVLPHRPWVDMPGRCSKSHCS
ncbi:hypothetical protein BDP81DRAFT_415934 [Colletotrichum phormii]|uniref:Uncharacterized protein n=1 Tax=Colletotrichum phormii TaxID=359342 RepID=A0AAJ0EMJ8_9PEZI|nr:uncharacterized protein BDP81DRAFT_415934 [Colletotrichum phormii]KAK1654528.1 hypothetical protein BDP81DRAFT_415934 [Colletotrichum phormii]